MKKWLRKALVVSISALTFGMVTPSFALAVDETNSDQSSKVDSTIQHNGQVNLADYQEVSEGLHKEDFLKSVVSQAEIKALEKFGTKIGPVIEDEFRSEILPKIEAVIESVATQYPTEDLSQLVISEHPTGGMSEKIFHIYDKNTGKDVIRFHVRRDHPPLDGYWFNFHYHTHHDQFQTHHDLGSIYWDKNTPPKWMS